MILAILSLLGIIPFSSASWGLGRCKKYEIMRDVDLEKYYGTWYEIVRDSTFFWGKGGSCTEAVYTPVEGEDYFQVVNSAIKNDKWSSFTGKARAQENGALEVKFFWFAPWGDYEVIDTDYATYSLVHSCENYLFFHHNNNWLLARDRFYKPTQEQVDQMIELGTTESDLVYDDQENCPAFPSSN